MNIHSKPGDKVIVTAETVNNGYSVDKERVSQYLKMDTLYEVEKTEVFDFTTNVFLKAFPGISFNSVSFCNTVEIDKLVYVVNDTLADFSINQAPSTTIAFFGYHLKKRWLFVQFKNGKSYIYNNVAGNIEANALAAESLTKFLIPAVRDCSFQKFECNLINLADI